jgi:hypothetical protein
MESENTIANTQDAATGAVSNEATAQEQRMFTQDELNQIVSKRIAQVNSKFDGVDVDEYRRLKNLASAQEEEQLMKRNEFEKLLKKTKESADGEITKLRSELERIKIDGALISAASQLGSVNPEHIAQLLKNNVALDGNGSVVIRDSEGNIRYNDSADPMTVNDLVDEFLAKNTYYRAAGPAGTGAQSNVDTKPSAQSADLSKLDLSRPDHREIYKQLRAAGKV